MRRSRPAAWLLVVCFTTLIPGALARAADPAAPSLGEGPQPPDVAATLFDVADDLRWEQVLAEPTVVQPVSLTFDERGRMWVVQYLQYPFPAGLKLVSRDNYWRTVYDKVPAAPGTSGHVPGADKITIHEDTDGDGTFDKHKTFVDGLNITTACEIGRGGVWVLNPPYLLFYPDKNGDDVPDGPPEVHLQGFGLEDTHSVVNSLTWGPDGWLYAAQGSTVTAKVSRPGSTEKPVSSIGQNIWRYHPETKRYEIFAEGGGNAFGVDIDAAGRVFSGHNGGDTRGFHYVQGGYFQKGFSKHGSLSNPYAYGYFPMMESARLPRFTHDILRYDAEALPESYRGGLFGVAPLQSELTFSKLIAKGSTFKTEDVSKPVKSRDPWFRPVAMALGPDGSIYVCDWYDKDVSHLKTSEGKVDDARGRIYRLRGKDAPPAKMGPDLGKLSTPELVATLKDSNRSLRRAALRVLGDRPSQEAVDELAKLFSEASQAGDGQTALEALWGLHAAGASPTTLLPTALDSADPAVRSWGVRLFGDRVRTGDEASDSSLAQRLVRAVGSESNVEARGQLAATAKRLPAAEALEIALALTQHDADVDDPYVPLEIWWAIEAQCAKHRDLVVKAFTPSEVWARPLVRKHLAQRLMRRFAEVGTQPDLLACAQLVAAAPDVEAKKLLVAGFEQAYEGRSIAGVPETLLEALGAVDGSSLVLKLRQGRRDAVTEALAIVADPKAPAKARVQYLQVFGQIKEPACVPTAIKVLTEPNDAIRSAALGALSAYDDPRIGPAVVEAYPKFSPDVQATAQVLLASRAKWAGEFLSAAVAKKLDASSTPLDVRRKFLQFRDGQIESQAKAVWGVVSGATTEQMEAEAKRLTALLEVGHGSPYEGKKLYRQSCGKCHLLFDDGGKIGPDLTPYQREQTANLVLNVVNPSAAIREGFEGVSVETIDGRTLSGFLIEKNDRLLVLRGLDGRDVAIEQADVAETTPLGKSLMPEGLLGALDPQQIRDLFAYLRSTQPLND